MFFPHNPRSDQLVLSSQLIPILSTVLKANSKAFQVYSLYSQSLLSRASQFTRGTDLLPDAQTQYSLIGCLYLHPAWPCPLSSLDTRPQPPLRRGLHRGAVRIIAPTLLSSCSDTLWTCASRWKAAGDNRWVQGQTDFELWSKSVIFQNHFMIGPSNLLNKLKLEVAY